MRNSIPLASMVLLAACAARGAAPDPPAAVVLPESTTVVDAATGAPVSVSDLVRRVRTADFVLLGEIHDNPAHHQARAALLEADSARKPAVVFEQLAWSTGPLPPPASGQSEEDWLDAQGFDRKGWKWPLHKPIVDAALADAGSLWGSNVPRQSLFSVVKEGVAAAPPDLVRLITEVPLDSTAQAAIDQELFEGHCGKLPATMMPGMRAAQEVRDAAMTDALLAAGATGPAWLIAGDGHVRMDMGVPRMLRTLAPEKTRVVVGFVERGTDEAKPGPAAGKRYQILVITPAAPREDPCKGLE